MSSWQQKPLGEFIELKRGYDLPSRDRLPGPFPLITSSGPTELISESRVKGPGVVTGRYGTVGQIFYVKEDFWPLNTALYVRDFRGNDPRFVYYFLHGINWEKFNDKSGVPGINRNDVHREPVLVPSLDLQKSIASALSALDEKIELNRSVNRTLENMAQALFRDWFVDFGPVRRKQTGAIDPIEIIGPLTPDPAQAAELVALFPTTLDEAGVPSGWVARAIGDLVEISGGSTPSTANEALWRPAVHRWATPKDLSSVSDFALFETGRRISDAGLAGITSGLLPPGTVLLSSRAPIGYLAIAQAPVAINQGFIALRPTADVGSAYLYLWCKANMDAILANANGSTFQEISKKSFRPIATALPTDTLIFRAFAKIADPLIARIVSAAAETRILVETRDYLLPRLMSGAISVKDIANSGGHVE